MPRGRKSFPKKATVIPPKGLYTFASHYGVSRKDAQRYWKEAGQSCFGRYKREKAGVALGPHRIRGRDSYFRCVMGVTKRILGHKAAKTRRQKRRIAAKRPFRAANPPRVDWTRKPVRINALYDGYQWVFDFANGRGASVVRHRGSYGFDQGLFELAILNRKGEIDYTTPIAKDVIGYLDKKAVESLLDRIAKLPRARGKNPLTKKETKAIMAMAKEHKGMAKGKRKQWHKGQAHAYWDVAEEFGPVKNPLTKVEVKRLMADGIIDEQVARHYLSRGKKDYAALRLGSAEGIFHAVKTTSPTKKTREKALRSESRVVAKSRRMMAKNPLLLSVNPPSRGGMNRKTVSISSLSPEEVAKLKRDPSWRSYVEQHGKEPTQITVFDMGGSRETRVLAGVGEKLEEQYSVTGEFANSKKAKISKHWVHEYGTSRKAANPPGRKPILAYDPRSKTFHTFPRSSKTRIAKDGYIHG